MKKILMFLTACAMVLPAIAQSPAQSDEELRQAILGSYTYKQTESFPGGGGRAVTEAFEKYNADGTFYIRQNANIRINNPQGGQIKFDMEVTMEGTYSITNGVISYVPDPKALEMSITPDGSEMSQMYADMFAEHQEEQRAEMMKPENLEQMNQTIVSIDDKQMVTKGKDGKKITHKRQ